MIEVKRALQSVSERALSLLALVLASALAQAQVANFQIVWINIGEMAAAADGSRARAGRQLFMAPDLVELSLHKVTVAKVNVEPSIVPLEVGQRFCLTSLRVQASSEDGGAVKDAPLTVSVRQDQRARLAIQRSRRNICFRPAEGGEYPVRFNSLLPARDGTTRGAQIFLRVTEAESRSESMGTAAD